MSVSGRQNPNQEKHGRQIIHLDDDDGTKSSASLKSKYERDGC